MSGEVYRKRLEFKPFHENDDIEIVGDPNIGIDLFQGTDNLAVVTRDEVQDLIQALREAELAVWGSE